MATHHMIACRSARFGSIVAVVACVCTAAFSQAPPQPEQPRTAESPRFVVPTRGKIGFADGDAFYPIRMNASAFRERFGEPDQKMMAADGKTISYFNYFGSGLQIAIRNNGTCWSYVFHTIPVSYPRSGQNWKAASIATDSGIRAGMSFDEVKKIAPPRETRGSGETITAIYSWGAIFFEKGRLVGIEVTDVDRNRREGKPVLGG